MNEENLVRGSEAHELTREDRAKGGRSRTISKSLINRQLCNSKCPIFPCFFSATAAKKDEKGRNTCKLKEFPILVQQRVTNLFARGRDGLLQEMMGELLGISVISQGDMRAKCMLFDRYAKLYEILHGGKQSDVIDEESKRLQRLAFIRGVTYGSELPKLTEEEKEKILEGLRRKCGIT
jgi:hypothetical protein